MKNVQTAPQSERFLDIFLWELHFSTKPLLKKSFLLQGLTLRPKATYIRLPPWLRLLYNHSDHCPVFHILRPDYLFCQYMFAILFRPTFRAHQLTPGQCMRPHNICRHFRYKSFFALRTFKCSSISIQNTRNHDSDDQNNYSKSDESNFPKCSKHCHP